MKTRIVAGILLFLLFACACIGVYFLFFHEEKLIPDMGMDSYEEDVYYVNTEHKVAFYCFGEPLEFIDEVTHKEITEITEDSIEMLEGCDTAYIIINDSEGNTVLKDSDWKYLHEKTRSDDNYNYMYIGEKQLLKAAELKPDDIQLQAGDFSYGATHENGVLVSVYGTCTKEHGVDPSSVLYTLVFSLKYKDPQE